MNTSQTNAEDDAQLLMICLLVPLFIFAGFCYVSYKSWVELNFLFGHKTVSAKVIDIETVYTGGGRHSKRRPSNEVAVTFRFAPESAKTVIWGAEYFLISENPFKRGDEIHVEYVDRAPYYHRIKGYEQSYWLVIFGVNSVILLLSFWWIWRKIKRELAEQGDLYNPRLAKF